MSRSVRRTKRGTHARVHHPPPSITCHPRTGSTQLETARFSCSLLLRTSAEGSRTEPYEYIIKYGLHEAVSRQVGYIGDLASNYVADCSIPTSPYLGRCNRYGVRCSLNRTRKGGACLALRGCFLRASLEPNSMWLSRQSRTDLVFNPRQSCPRGCLIVLP